MNNRLKAKQKKLAKAIKLSHIAYSSFIASNLVAALAWAGPEGGNVIDGDAEISQNETDTVINQASERLAVEWNTFNLDEDERVEFIQPSSSSVALNRILDQSPSTIRGNIEANGHVVLVNPRGILFTETSTVNVGAITASGLDVSTEEFLKSGEINLSGVEGSAGYVINKGVINASSAALVGKHVANTNLIKADMINLSAGSEAIVTFDSDGLLGVEITKEVLENAGYDSAVLNSGNLEAKQVVMDARVSSALFTNAVNNSGVVKAKGIDTSGGKIRLFGGGGSVINSGNLDASAEGENANGGHITLEGTNTTTTGTIVASSEQGTGGEIHILGDEVSVDGNINVAGAEKGGEILIGGDQQGKNDTIRNAQTTTVKSTAVIDASGNGEGDGGKVIVWSDGKTYFYGNIDASAGLLGGDGGFIETSGKEIVIRGEVLARGSSTGNPGVWLIDPENFTIDTSCADDATNCMTNTDIEKQLVSGTDVSINVTGQNEDTANIIVATSIKVDGNTSPEATAPTLTLTADGNIELSPGVNITGDAETGLNVVLSADDNVTIRENSTIQTYGGTFNSTSANFVNDGTINTLVTSDGSVTRSGVVTITVNGANGSSVNKLGTIHSETATVSANSDNDAFTIKDNTTFVLTNNENNDNKPTLTSTEDRTASDEENSYEQTLTIEDAEKIIFEGVGTIQTGLERTFELVLDESNNLINNALRTTDISFEGLNNLVGTSDAKITLSGTELAKESATLTVTDDTITASAAEISIQNISSLNALEAVTLELTEKQKTAGYFFGTELDTSELDTSKNTIYISDSNGTKRTLTFQDITAITGSRRLKISTRSNLNLSEFDTDTFEEGGIEFNGITEIENTGTLTATNGDETFTQTSSGISVESAGITFIGLTGLNAGEGDDSLTTLATSTIYLTSTNVNDVSTATTGQVSLNNTITFSNIENVTAKNIQGSDAADTISDISSTGFKANDVTFTVPTSEEAVTINLGGGDDSLTALATSTVNLTSSTNEGVTTADKEQISLHNFIFSDIENVTAQDIQGSDAADTISEITTTGFKANDVTFTAITTPTAEQTVTIDLGNGDDIFDAGSATLTGTNNQITSNNFIFSDIQRATSRSVTGTNLADTFEVINSSGDIKSYGVIFESVAEINAGEGQDKVTLLNDTEVKLTKTDKQLQLTTNKFTVNSTLFSNIETVENGTLLIDSNAEEVLNSNSNLHDGNANLADNFIAISNDDNKNGVKKINFTSLKGIELGSINDKNIALEIIFNSSSTSGETNYREISIQDGNLYFGGVKVGGAENIHFKSGDERSAIGSGLGTIKGSNDAESFEIKSDNTTNAVTVLGATITGVNSINAGDGNDTLTSSLNVSLSNTNNQVSVTTNPSTSQQITLTGIENVSASTIIGTESNDIFEENTSGNIESYGITFSDVTNINAGEGNDRLTTELDASTVNLTSAANAEGVNTAVTGQVLLSNTALSKNINITFSNIENVTTKNIQGSDAADTISEITTTGFKANDVTFTAITTPTAEQTVTIDLGNGDDIFDAGSATLTGTNNQITSNNFIFSDIQRATSRSVTGTNSADTFEENTDGDIESYGITFTDVTSINAGGGEGDDSLTTLATSTIYLTSTNVNDVSTATTGQVSLNNTITFSNIENVTAKNIQGSDAADTISEITTTGFNANGVTFTAFSTFPSADETVTVNLGNGSDLFDAGSATLTGTNNQITSNNFIFSDIQRATSRSVTGTNSADTFEENTDGDIQSYGITFSDVTNINAGEGNDRLTTELDASTVNLTSAANAEGVNTAVTGQVLLNNTALSKNITFSNIENVTTKNIQGSDAADTISEVTNTTFTANGVTFTAFSTSPSADETVTVNLGNGSDLFDAGSATLTGTNNQITSNNFIFSDIQRSTSRSVTGTNSADTFEENTDGDIESYGITFTDVTSINAGDGEGHDSLTTLATSTIYLTSTNVNDVSTAITGQVSLNNAITFSNIENVTAKNIQGSDAADTISEISSTGFTANDVTFTAFTPPTAEDTVTINLGDGDDAFNIASITLGTTNNQITQNGFTFNSVNASNATSVTGSSEADTFTLSSSGLLARGISLTNTAPIAIDTAGGTDSLNVTTNAAAEMTGNSKEVEVGTVRFSNIEEVSSRFAVGTTKDDTVNLDGANAFTAYNINFTGQSSVDLGNGNDKVTGGTNWSLLGTNSAQAEGITFSNLNEVSTTNAALAGTSSADSFEVTGSNNLTSYGIAFSGINSVSATNGSDTIVVDNSANQSVLLTGVNNEASTNNISFTGIDVVSGGQAIGSDENDIITLTGTNAFTANAIAFSNQSSLDLGSGNDVVNGGTSWSLLGTNSAQAESITFSNLNQVSATNATLAGTSSADSFEVTGSNNLTSYGIAFSGINSVSATNGSDTIVVDNSANQSVLLTGVNNEATTNSINFTGIEVVSGGQAVGTAKDDTVNLDGANAFTAYNINFTGQSSVDLGNGNDKVTGGTSWSLVGTNSAQAQGITFSNLNEVSTTNAALAGTSSADSFEVTGSNNLTSYGIAFSGINSVSATNGSDTIVVDNSANQSVLLTGVNNEASTNNISFTGIDVVSGGQAIGSDENDIITLTGTNAFTANAIAFSNHSRLDLGKGNDKVTGGTNWSLLGTNSAQAEGITFSNLNEVTTTNAALAGTSLDDRFEVTGSNSLKSYDITFSGINSVSATNGSDTIAVNNSANQSVLLTGLNNEATTNNISFTGIDVVSSGQAIGSDENDTITLTGTNAFTANAIAFSNQSSLDLGSGNDVVNGGTSWSLLGTNSAQAEGITFSNLNQVSATNATLAGTSSADSFEVTGSNSLKSYDITFSGINSVSAAENSDTIVVDNSANQSVLLTGVNNEATTNSINFTGIEVVSGGQAVGTAKDDTVSLDGANAFTAYNINFTGQSSVDLGNGNDKVTGGTNWSLLGTNSAQAEGITFSNLNEVSTTNAALAGTSSADSFEVTGSNNLTSYGIAFSGINSVSATNGSDTIVVDNSANQSVLLTGVNNEASTNNISFTGIDVVSGGQAIGSDENDIITLTGTNAFTANAIAFSNQSSLDLGSGNDVVNGGTSWSLLGTNSAQAESITFSNLNQVSATNATLAGTSSADSFEVTGSNSLKSYDITFSGINSVSAAENSDTIVVDNSANQSVLLTGVNNEATTNSINFTGIEVVSGGQAVGTAKDDTVNLDGANAFTAYNINFTGQSSVDLGNGNDKVTGGTSWSLVGTNSAQAQGITFSNLNEVSTTNAALAGTSSADSFEVTGSNNLTSYGIAFSGINSVSATNGSDTIVVDNSANQSVLLTGVNNEASTNNISFTGIDVVSGGQAIGSDNNDIITLTGTNAFTANAIAFSNQSSLDLGEGEDTVNGGSEWQINGDNNATASGVTFTSLENIAASSATITGLTSGTQAIGENASGVLSAHGMSISGAAAFIGNNNYALDVEDGYALSLTGTNNEINSASVNYSGITQVTGGLITGSANADSLVFDTANDTTTLRANNIFIDVPTEIDLGDGSNSVTGADGVSWALTGESKAIAAYGVTISNVENLSGTNGKLVGTDAADTFTESSNGVISTSGLTVNGLTSINAGGSKDTFTALDTTSLTLTGTNKEVVIGSITVSDIETVKGGTTISGSDNADTVVLTGINSGITGNGILFDTPDAQVNLGGGTNTVVGASGAEWQYLSANSISGYNITFTGVNSVNSGGDLSATLTTTSGPDTISTTASNSAVIGGITFSDLTTVHAGAEEGDALNISGDFDSGNEAKTVEANGISFTGIDQFGDSIDLSQLTNYDEVYVIGDGTIRIRGISQSNVSTFNVLETATVFSLAGTDWTLNGTTNSATTSNITFTNLHLAEVDSGNLIGTAGNDIFTENANGTLSSYGIEFSNLAGVDGANGYDILNALAGSTVQLSGRDHALSSRALNFVNMDQVNGGQLKGSDRGDELTFVTVNDSLMVSADNINYSLPTNTVDLGKGEDTVNGGSEWQINGDNNATALGVTFTSLENIAASSATITGLTSGTQAVSENASGVLSTHGMSISGAAAFIGNNNYALDVEDGYALSLTGTNNEINSASVNYSGITQVTDGLITGSTMADGLVFDTANDTTTLRANNIFIDVPTAIDLGNGSDSVTGADGVSWALTGTDNTIAAYGVTISNVENLSSTNGVLTGTNAEETFKESSNGVISTSGLTVNGLTSINAGGSKDTFTALDTTSLTLTGTNKEVDIGSITVSDIETVKGGTTISGSDNADTVVLTGINSGITGNGILFDTPNAEVNLRGGTNTVVGASNAEWQYLSANSISGYNITFTGVNSVNSGDDLSATLTTTSGPDTISTTASNSAEIGGITFSDLTTVHAGAESGDSIKITGNFDTGNEANTVEANGVLFTGIDEFDESIDLNRLTNYSEIHVLGNNRIQIKGISQSNRTSLNVLDNATVYSLVGANWTLNGSDNAASTSAITFTNLHFAQANSGSLMGTAGNDTFTENTKGSLSSYGIEFSNLTGVDGANGYDILNALVGSTVQLSGVDHALSSRALSFINMDQVNGGQLKGSTGDDALAFVTVNDSLMLRADSINYSLPTNTVDLGDGEDSVTGLDGSNWQVGNNGFTTSNDVTFSDIESVAASNSTLTGTSSTDIFTEEANGSISVNEVNYEGLIAVDAKDGDDNLIAQNGSVLTLTGSEKELRTDATLFSNLESADNGQLVGSSNADRIDITGNQSFNANSIAFSGRSSLDLAGGADTITGIAGESWTLNADNTASSSNITFSNATIINADSSSLNTAVAFRNFTVNGENNLVVADINFLGLSTINAGTDTDTLTSFGAVTLTGSDKEVMSGNMRFTNIDVVNGGDLIASDDDDEVVLNSSGGALTLTANAIVFSAPNSLDLLEGNDTVFGASGSDWIIIDEKTAQNSNITFSNVENLIADNAGLQGTAGNDTFDLNIDNTIISAGMSFSGVNAVFGLDGSDTVNALVDDSWKLTGAENQVQISGIEFSSIEIANGGQDTLIGSDLSDIFVLDTNGRVTANEIIFTDATSANAGDGLDIASGVSGETWTLLAGNNQVASQGFSFSNLEQVNSQDITINASGQVSAKTNGLEQVNSQNLVISANEETADTFQVSGSSVNTRAITFNSVSQVNAGNDAGDILVDEANSNWQIQGANNLNNGNIEFTGIDIAQSSNATLIGQENIADQFALNGTNGQLSSAGILFEGVSSINGNGGSDHLIGNETDDIFDLSTNGDVNTAGMSFSGLAQVSGNGGSDTVNSARGAGWTSHTENGELVEQSAVALLDNVNVIFTDIDQINSTGAYVGQDVATTFELTGTDSMIVSGVNYNGVTQLSAGAATDTIVGPNENATWALSDGQGLLTLGQNNLTFTGIEILETGNAADQVTVNGGTWERISTGGGNDEVTLGGSISTVDLGAGNDKLVTANNPNTQVNLIGGEGVDTLNSSSGETWNINESINGENTQGNLAFLGFESLENNADNLLVNTNGQIEFSQNGSLGFTNRNMDLSYNAGGNIGLNTTASGTAITGHIDAANVDIVSAGNIDVTSKIDEITIRSANSGNQATSIDVKILEEDNLQVNVINVTEGKIFLGNIDLVGGSLDFNTENTSVDSLHGGEVTLGDETSEWQQVSGPTNFYNVKANSLNIRALSFTAPTALKGNTVENPSTNFSGTEIPSAGSLASQGARTAQQDQVDDFVQIDPAIFEAVSPYSIGVNAVQNPEMRLVSGVLLPVEATATGGEDSGESGPKFEENFNAPQQKPSSEDDSASTGPGSNEISELAALDVSENRTISLTLIETDQEKGAKALPELKTNYPESYSIETGDTLWDIAEKFLKDPFQWRNLWENNPQIQNPNNIYPGDIIRIIVIKGKGFLSIQSGEGSDAEKSPIDLGQFESEVAFNQRRKIQEAS